MLLTDQLSTDIKTSVTNLFTAAELLRPTRGSRSALGIILQNPAVRPWSRSIVWAAVMEILPVWSGWNSDCEAISERYLTLQQHIKESGLDVDIDKAPLINVSSSFEWADCQGHEIQSLLDIRPSPLFNVIRRAVNEWQLEHPEATKADAEAWLKEQWEGSGRADWEAQVPSDKPKAEKRKRWMIDETTTETNIVSSDANAYIMTMAAHFTRWSQWPFFPHPCHPSQPRCA
jgi:tRNA nucleotidyltransferase (CCA-adding enzyme)